ncbi:MAG: indolepyruvate ferredoxin oxidoreductase, partial [Cytophagales bacterium]|nr:indolepyruvate ferredoxin oxidoreductase [Cytophagales bacterium]
EKTAYEACLGTSVAGKRTIASMKHVGLNVAADPFINSALLAIKGGMMLAVADDPGMHSSQNEQDSRFYADFAHVICLEPANQQEAYDMTRTAYDISEEFQIPIMLRMVTRLAHSRAAVNVRAANKENKLQKAPFCSTEWNILPSNARILWKNHLKKTENMRNFSENSKFNTLRLNNNAELGIITTGIARNYYNENRSELEVHPSH